MKKKTIIFLRFLYGDRRGAETRETIVRSLILLLYRLFLAFCVWRFFFLLLNRETPSRLRPGARPLRDHALRARRRTAPDQSKATHKSGSVFAYTGTRVPNSRVVTDRNENSSTDSSSSSSSSNSNTGRWTLMGKNLIKLKNTRISRF